MGEKFAANPVTGTASMAIPLALSPSRSGFGPFGFGWSLSLPSVTRKTHRGTVEAVTGRLEIGGLVFLPI